MPETPENNNPPTPEEILADIHAKLKDSNAQTRIVAIQKLGGQKFSSPAILQTLEQLALHDRSKSVREAARQALKSPAHRYIQGHTTKLKRKDRKTILDEIAKWEEHGIIQADQADVIRHRYDFDLEPPAPLQEGSSALQAQPKPVTIKESPPKPETPRPGLTQTLLSEASIKIALYLGAFFVIAAAAILAAVVEAARLPILFIATALFAGSAIFTRKRLHQPSFALFIVFSFLLPTDANVLADVLNLSSKASSGYWFAVMALMALIWGLSTWFYTSRLFSLAAFIALGISVFRLGELFDELEIYMLLFSMVTLIGLGSAYILKRWQSKKFSLPLIILVQIAQLTLNAFALLALAIRLENFPSIWNLASAFFWLLTAGFYVLSDLSFTFVLFPWLAATALYLVPLAFMTIFDVEALPIAIVTWLWGALLSLGSELLRRMLVDKIRRYVLPLLVISILVTLTATLIGYGEDITFGFGFNLVSAILFALLHIIRPRVYLWTTALLLGLGAYFSFFALPFMEDLNIFAGYQLLGASLFLLIPDLFLSLTLFEHKTWRWPLRILGGILVFINLSLLLPVSGENAGDVALVYSIYTAFFVLYAVKFDRAWIGYISTASAALGVTFALQYLELDAWLLTLTVLSALYYLAGYLLGRNEARASWSNMLRYSGLGLASLVSTLAIVNFEASGGWYILATALLFGIEMFSRRTSLAEAGIQLFLASGIFILLREADVARGFQWLGVALSLLGADLFLARTYTDRRLLRWLSRGFGALVVAINSFDLLFNNGDPQVGAVCFAVYMLFFVAQALSYRQSVLGYGFTSYSLLTVIFTLRAFEQPKWILPLTVLASIYYGIGFFMRKGNSVNAKQNDEDIQSTKLVFNWPFVMWTSGLSAGLMSTIVAPMQGGLVAAIPPAVTATLIAVEAFDRRNVWLGFPVNALYLMAYFILLIELNVDEPQFFSIATAMLGLLMHYLLTRAGSRTGAFITGMVSQLVLLGTTYIQFVSTEGFAFFFALFFQAIVVLAYGIVTRSRSLVITPIIFAVLSVITVLYGLLEGILPVILIGCTGLILLLLGILAVVLRDRVKKISERFNDWGA